MSAKAYRLRIVFSDVCSALGISQTQEQDDRLGPIFWAWTYGHGIPIRQDGWDQITNF